MRETLKSLENQFVVCKGWVQDWETLSERTTRVCVSKPVIKQPNKHVIFDELATLSIEHHLNLFIVDKSADFYGEDGFGMHKPIFFSGVIQRYVRKDGSEDYGVYPIKHSSVPLMLRDLNRASAEAAERGIYTADTAIWIEQTVKPMIPKLREALERAGDMLPTFFATYQDYVNTLDKWEEYAMASSIMMQSVSSNRAFRRKHKVSKSFLDIMKS